MPREAATQAQQMRRFSIAGSRGGGAVTSPHTHHRIIGSSTPPKLEIAAEQRLLCCAKH